LRQWRLEFDPPLFVFSSIRSRRLSNYKSVIPRSFFFISFSLYRKWKVWKVWRLWTLVGPAAALESSSWNDPSGFCKHDNMKPVRDLGQVNSFSFNREPFLGDHSLKAAYAAFVATPIGFVSDEQDAILQVPVELPNDFFPRGDLECVGTEDPFQATNQGSFACALTADKQKGYLSLLGRILDRPCNPVFDVVGKLGIASGDDFVNVLFNQTPVSWHRLATPALPKVETFVDHRRSTWKE
jgi:hypothetical protein